MLAVRSDDRTTPDTSTTGRRQRRRRRSAAADLHVLPPRARRSTRRSRCTLRTLAGLDDARDRARVPRSRADDGAAARAGEAQDPQRRDPVPRPARAPAARADRLRCWRSSICSSTRATRRPRAPSSCASDLCAEAIRLARTLAELMPDEPEALGLLALMLLHDARRAARVDAAATSSRSRSRTARAGTAPRSPKGVELLDARAAARQPGSVSGAGRDRRVPRDRARRGRDRLGRDRRALRRARRGWSRRRSSSSTARSRSRWPTAPRRGCASVDALDASGALAGYHLLPATRADFLRRLGRTTEAAAAYRAALGVEYDRRRTAVSVATARGERRADLSHERGHDRGHDRRCVERLGLQRAGSTRYERPHRSSRRPATRGRRASVERAVLRLQVGAAAHEGADPRRADEVDAGEIDDHVRVVLGDRIVERFRRATRARPRRARRAARRRRTSGVATGRLETDDPRRTSVHDGPARRGRTHAQTPKHWTQEHVALPGSGATLPNLPLLAVVAAGPESGSTRRRGWSRARST